MTAAPLFPGFDGLMTLSRREGVDIRPTLLRVLTDLYVQAHSHSPDEERQFVELTSRLIEQVDDATRAAVRARLAIYPGTPLKTLIQLGLEPAHPGDHVPLAQEIAEAPALAPEQPARQPSAAELRLASQLSMQPNDAAEISELFFAAGGSERAAILYNLNDTPLKASARIPEPRAKRALHILEMAAFASDAQNFALELGEALILPARIAEQVTSDPGGEPLACAMKALGTSSPIFQRILLFLNPQFGTSVEKVFRISRMYERLSERSALVMIAAWRGSSMATARAKYRPALYDDERQRARSAGPSRSTVQPGSAPTVRTGTDKPGR